MQDENDRVCGMYQEELHTGTPERNRPFGTPRHRRDDSINFDLKYN
jgi:hypothetical protein